jgi:ornithine cyclodeaminase
VIVAFDGSTGSPLAVIDGTELTYWKTAASSGLAASYLAPPEPRTLLLVGAGGLAPYLVHVHRAVRPSIERVLVWNRSTVNSEKLVEHPMLGDGAIVVEDLDAAVGEADVISTATRSESPLVRGRSLKPGSHLDLVGGYTPTMREADDEAVRRGTLFADAAIFSIDHCGDLSDPIARGVIDRSDVRADLFGLCRGEHPGRSGTDEITIFKSGGGAHLDLFATRYALENLT